MTPHRTTLATCLFSLFIASGCAFHVDWPDRSTEASPTLREYRIGGAKKANYRQELVEGRVRTLLFDEKGEGAFDRRVELSGNHHDWPHFVIVCDGVPWELVQRMYEEGHFRLFGPPSRVVSVFPAMTDVALAKIFHTNACIAAESLYFDRQKNAMSNGNDVYLKGENAPWRSSIDYYGPQSIGIQTYLNPPAAFSRELQSMYELFNKTKSGRAVAYLVSTAGMGTRQGEKGIRSYLGEIEKMCERITYDRRGQVRFSILADHGQGLRECKLADFTKTLADARFNLTEKIKGDKDVVMPGYGLVTCAQAHTNRPREVAGALLKNPTVELAMFKDGDSIVIQSPTATAALRRTADGRFTYDDAKGDPLAFGPIIDKLKKEGRVTAEGVIDDRALFEATAKHRFPDALHRIWDAFHGLLQKPADVYLSLKDDACYGSKFFYFFVGPVASTHGSLASLSSVTLLMTNATELPPVMRVEDEWAYIGPRTTSDPAN